jgi:hypothetical protein
MLVHNGRWDKGSVVWWVLKASAFVRASRRRPSYMICEGDSHRTELHVVGSGVYTYEAKKGRKERKKERTKQLNTFKFITNSCT